MSDIQNIEDGVMLILVAIPATRQATDLLHAQVDDIAGQIMQEFETNDREEVEQSIIHFPLEDSVENG